MMKISALAFTLAAISLPQLAAASTFMNLVFPPVEAPISTDVETQEDTILDPTLLITTKEEG